MEIDFIEFQDAFVSGKITFEQFVHVIMQNFGVRNTKSIIKKILKSITSVDEYRILKRDLDHVMRTCYKI